MTGILNLLMGTVRPAGATADPYFEYTTLLLPGSGTNGAQNNTFLDGSTNNFTITRNGNTTQGTFSPFSQTGWGNYFDGSLYYLTASGNPNITTNFTIEFWFYMPSWGDRVFLSQGGGAASFSTSNGVAYQIYATSTTFYVQWSNGAGGQVEISTPTSGIATNTWHHVAIGNNATTTRLWIDGTSIGTNTSNPTWYYPTTRSTYVGYISYTSSYRATGYLSNVRIVTSDVYGANNSTITVPTSPLTAITNTQLLTCQSNRFRDASNTYTLTVTGTPSVVAFSPFNPTASWSAATYGGSGYFDGSGDYLGIADNDAFALGSNDWTIECWVYVSSLSSQGFVAQVASNGADASIGFVLGINASGYPYVASYINGAYTAATASTAIVVNQWNHIAGSRASGTMGVFLNGSRLASTAVSGSSVNSTATVTVGASNSGASALTTGYIANARIVNGTAVYSGTTYTVPTAPLTAITNTSLLLNCTNAGIYDATSKNDLETVGDAQISNAVTPKWGSTSIKFDGTGDYLRVPDSPLFSMGSGNFTIDGWVYRSGSGATQIICCQGGNTGSSTSFGLQINSSNQLSGFVYSGTTLYITNSTATVSANQWVYVAMVRDGNTITLYINGSADGTVSVTGVSVNDSAQPLGIGTYGDTVGAYFNGYIQDLRITRGYARTITTPTAAFPTL